MTDEKNPKTDVTALDAAIAAAKKSKKAKETAKAEDPATTEAPAKPVKKEKAPKAEKPAKAPKAEKPAKPAREPKSVDARLEKAVSALPVLSDRAHTAFCSVIDDVPPYTTAELLALSAHFGFEARKQALAGAISSKPVKGSHVIIESGTGGAAKYIGMRGVVVEARNVRCFVDVKDGSGKTVKKALYLYTSDVSTCEAPAAEESAAAEETPAPASEPVEPAADTQPAPETTTAAAAETPAEG